MIKKPLVLTGGEIEQLQSGDVLLPIPSSLSLTNGSVVDLPPGVPAYIESANTFERATADAYPNVIGLTTEGITSSVNGIIQTDGVLTLSTAEWDAVTGDTGGLTPGATYYLATIGGLAIVAVATGYLTRIGIAVNDTDLDIKISRPIKL